MIAFLFRIFQDYYAITEIAEVDLPLQRWQYCVYRYLRILNQFSSLNPLRVNSESLLSLFYGEGFLSTVRIFDFHVTATTVSVKRRKIAASQRELTYSSICGTGYNCRLMTVLKFPMWYIIKVLHAIFERNTINVAHLAVCNQWYCAPRSWRFWLSPLWWTLEQHNTKRNLQSVFPVLFTRYRAKS